MKKLKISNILILICLMSLTINILAQQTVYTDSHYGKYATSDSRVVTTIREFENSDEVQIEALLIGELNVGIFQMNLFYDPEVVVPTKGPGGDAITTKLNGNGKALGEYLWLNPNLPNAENWRLSATGQVNPHVNKPWTYIMAGGNEGLGTDLVLSEGNVLQVFKLYFKKLPGKSLTNNTFTYYEKLNVPQVRNLFSRGYSFVYMSGETNDVTSFQNTNLFSRRIPSSVKTMNADVKGTSVTLNGLANSEGLAKVPAINGAYSGLDWDTIVASGFIYTKNDLLLTIDEYSKKIKLNNVEYDFPEITNGSFVLGTDTLFMVSEYNTNRNTRVAIHDILTALEPETEYYAYSFMKYKFQTSDEYPVLGERISFKTNNSYTEMTVNATVVTCSNEPSVNINYNVSRDGVMYKLIFDSESAQAGFNSTVNYTALPASSIEIAMPQGLSAGIYTATLYASYGNWEQSFDIEIIVNTLPVITATSEPEMLLLENQDINLFVEVDGEAQYQWYFDGNIIIGANESHYSDRLTAEREGTYSVEVSTECGSLLQFFNVKISPNGINENVAEGYSFKVYPNPVRRGETVSFLLDLPNSVAPDASAQIFDMTGRKVGEYKLNNHKTELSLNFSEGSYLVKVRTANGRELVSKVIVQ